MSAFIDNVIDKLNQEAVSFYSRIVNNNPTDTDKIIGTISCVSILYYFLFIPSTPKMKKTIPRKPYARKKLVNNDKFSPLIDKTLQNEDKINAVVNKFKTTFEKDCIKLLDPENKYNSNDDKMVYQQKFLGEMLMKLLLELDAVDVSEIEDVERKQNIKQMRKDGIKLIQGYLKPIDALKKWVAYIDDL